MRKIILSLLILFVVLMSGCSPSPAKSPSEEIVMYSWQLKNENEGAVYEELNGSVEFSDEKMVLSINKADGSKLKIEELYEINDTDIVIVSDKLGVMDFKYTLNNGELELTFDGKTLHFIKSLNSSADT